jgi:hypothetical protein
LRTKITKILKEKFGNKNIGTVEQNMAAKRNKASTEDQNESKYGTKLSNVGNKKYRNYGTKHECKTNNLARWNKLDLNIEQSCRMWGTNIETVRTKHDFKGNKADREGTK